MKEQKLKVLRVIWAIFLLSPAYQLFALYNLKSPETSALPFPPEIFQVAAGILAVGIVIAWRLLLSPTSLRGKEEKDVLSQFVLRHVILYVAAECIGFMGLWIGIATNDPSRSFLNYGLCFIVTAMMFPARERLEAALARK